MPTDRPTGPRALPDCPTCAHRTRRKATPFREMTGPQKVASVVTVGLASALAIVLVLTAMVKLVQLW